MKYLKRSRTLTPVSKMSTKTRVGRIQILAQPDGGVNVDAQGQLTTAEWIYALELLKAQFIANSRKGVPPITDLVRDIKGFNLRELS